MVTPELSRDILTLSRISAVPSILKVVAELTGMRFTVVARVTPDSWTACAVHDRMQFGMQAGDQLDVATTLCREVCADKKTIVIEHASLDPVYSEHPTPKLYKIESYIAVPILRANGEVFGTLCAIDQAPARLDSRLVTSLTLFTELIESQLRAEEQHASIMQTLWDERKISQLREQFIAVLGHDLRNPLGSIMGAADVLAELGLPPDAMSFLQSIQADGRQMARLIEDVLDFARGRLGEGMVIETQRFDDITPLVRQTIDQLRHSHPARQVHLSDSGPMPALVDEVRFRQLISNLVGNALQHSPADEPVAIRIDLGSRVIRITIKNGGPPLPADVAGDMFKPFQRDVQGKKKAGLGLGLYIAAQIARAHGGSLHGNSDASGTTFTLLIPSA